MGGTPRRASIGSMIRRTAVISVIALACAALLCSQTPATPKASTFVLRAAHLLDVAAGSLVSPGEVLVRGNRIMEAGASVSHPAGAVTLDLGDATLMPGLIDAHVHLSLIHI